MLEGDISVKTGPGTYLMIGMAGEVYPVDRSAFEKTYTPSAQPLRRDFVYPPTVVDRTLGLRVELAGVARCCESKEGRVLARRLDRGVKIFTAWDSDNYVKGEPGDWLVMRKEDHSDQYVVGKDIFARLYSPVQSLPGA